ncbi:MAG: phosphoglycerate kinase [Bacteroidales bacterium]|nr:phosphoglycerate kinase [Bacteroidales bacterium]
MQQHIDSYDFKGKKAIVRVDFNVPLDENFNITDDTRIRAALPTLKKVLAEGGALILMSHLGRPKGVTEKFSLKHIVAHVSECLGVPVQFADDCQKADAQAAALKPGEVLMLENLRFYAEEEGKPRGLAEDATDEEKAAAKKAVKESQKEFVKKLASYADCYINDAFGTAHRAHASTALIAAYFPEDKMFGYLMEKEIKAIDNVLKNARRPFTAIIGGSKVSSKLAVLENLLGKVDNLIICGGMGYTFIKAEGGNIGNSLHEDDLIPQAKEIMEKAQDLGVNVSLSVQTRVTQEFTNDTPEMVVPSHKIPDGWEGMDCGPASIENWARIILASKTILWNGPAGVFEFPNFATGTEKIAECVAKATERGAYTLVGGGDSVAAVTKMGFADKVSYVSTGGGAMLEAIEGKTLPGIAAIQE